MDQLAVQDAAIGGLFMALWGSVVRSHRYQALIREWKSNSKARFDDEVRGRLATWRTVLTSTVVRWKITFQDTSLGGWQVAIAPGKYGLFEMIWLSPDGGEEKRMPSFDEATFAAMFDTLRSASVRYIKHYQCSQDRAYPVMNSLLG